MECGALGGGCLFAICEKFFLFIEVQYSHRSMESEYEGKGADVLQLVWNHKSWRVLRSTYASFIVAVYENDADKVRMILSRLSRQMKDVYLNAAIPNDVIHHVM